MANLCRCIDSSVIPQHHRHRWQMIAQILCCGRNWDGIFSGIRLKSNQANSDANTDWNQRPWMESWPPNTSRKIGRKKSFVLNKCFRIWERSKKLLPWIYFNYLISLYILDGVCPCLPVVYLPTCDAIKWTSHTVPHFLCIAWRFGQRTFFHNI